MAVDLIFIFILNSAEEASFDEDENWNIDNYIFVFKDKQNIWVILVNFK